MEKEEFDKTVGILTPKFRKESNFNFPESSGKPKRRIWWRVGSVAAMIAVVVTLAVNTLMPVQAEEVVAQSLANFNGAKTYEIKFYVVGEIKNDELIPGGENEITGTLYLENDNGTEKARIEFDNADGLTEVYDGEWYKRYKNGAQVSATCSKPIGLLTMFSLDILKKQKMDIDITSKGDHIIVSHRKGEVIMTGVFSRETKKLVEAYVTQQDKKLLGTKSIEYGVKLPDHCFD